jgi:transposase
MKAKKDATKARNQYSPEFKKQALERAGKDGVTATARDLNLNEGQLYAWRQKQRLEGLTGEDQKLQQGELARIEEENAFLKKAAAYFAKSPK